MRAWFFSFILTITMAHQIYSGDENLLATAFSGMTENRLEAHVSFLASDLLEGRATATRGYDLAAQYVATQFQLAGVKPGGDTNSYFQQVPLRKADLISGKSWMKLIRNDGEEQLRYAEDYLMGADYLRTETELNADVVFAGYGVTAPELKYDDYASIDAKGKVVLILNGAPSSFQSTQRAHFASSVTKEKNAVAHGAIGIITFRTPGDEQRSPWERSVRQSKLSGYRWIDRDGKPNNVPEQIRGSAYLNRPGVEKFFRGAPTTLDEVFKLEEKGKLTSFALPAKISLRKVSTHSEVKSPNVAGIVEGTDPNLKTEYIVYSAHLDHVGITDPVDGDTINNGAYDNSVGIAGLIEIARAFTAVPPKRSILFLAVTAEEKGLQGSDYFAHYPTVPQKNIVANINTDMFLMLFPFTDAIAFGSEHSSLGPLAREALRTVGLKMSPDPAPDEVIFVRSDQYSFVKKGIPAICLNSGFQSGDPKIEGEKLVREWLRTRYHSPQDGLDQKMNWSSGIKLIQANFLIGFRAANEPTPPAWNAGDFFGGMFAK